MDTKPQVNGVISRRALLAGAVAVPLVAKSSLLQALAAEGITKVFVAGSTGNTGRRVVAQLRAAGYQVRAGVRDVGKALGLGLAVEGVELVSFDLLKGPAQLASAIGDAQAVVSAVGFTGFNPSGFGQVDETGTKALIDAAKAQGVTKFVMVSSLLTNAKAIGQADNPNYKFLNLFGGVLDHKLVSEQYLRGSGMDWTIIRPGGLSNEPPSVVGRLIARPEDSLFGLDSDPGREVSRDTVAAVCVAALRQARASERVVEVVASPQAPETPEQAWFP